MKPSNIHIFNIQSAISGVVYMGLAFCSEGTLVILEGDANDKARLTHVYLNGQETYMQFM